MVLTIRCVFYVCLCSIVKSFVKHAKDVSRIAPYLLLSTISLLVSDDQPTTNNTKVRSF